MKRRLTLVFLPIIIFSILATVYFTGFLNPPIAASNLPENTITAGKTGRLLVDGLVEHPLNLTLEDLMAMPKTTVNADLICVDFPNTPRSKGNWTGVRLEFVLEKAGISADAIKVAFCANDGYKTDLTISTAKQNDVILAYEKDGQALHENLRLVVPGKWGYKWIAWLTHIQLVDYDFKGTWENQGYSDTADITH